MYQVYVNGHRQGGKWESRAEAESYAFSFKKYLPNYIPITIQYEKEDN